VLWFVDGAVGAGLEYRGYAWWLLRFGEFTTFWWSVLNLLPVLPLDGGQAMRELLPGEPRARMRRAAVVSLVVLVPLLVLAILANQPWLGMFLLFFGLANIQTLRQTSDAAPGRGVPAAVAPAVRTPPGVTPEQAVVGLLWQGAPRQARELLESLPPGTITDLAVHGAVLAATDPSDQGAALLRQEVARRPGDTDAVALLVLAHALRRDWAAVEEDLTGPLAPDVPLALVERVMQEATAAGSPDVAARIGGLPRPRPRPAG